MKTRKTLVKSATLNKTAAATAVTVTTGANAPTQESIMTQIYTQPQSTGTITTTTKSSSKTKLTSTLIPANNKKTPLAMTLGASTGFNGKSQTQLSRARGMNRPRLHSATRYKAYIASIVNFDIRSHPLHSLSSQSIHF